MKTKSILLFLFTLSCLLVGCRMVALPGNEPFGEQTYSNERAQAVYENICEEMRQIPFSERNGYVIELNDSTVEHAFYRTEEYTIAWHHGAGKNYLWYQGRLYCDDGETLTYRDMTWQELRSDEYAEQQWAFASDLLTQEPASLDYKYIPMASDKGYLLTAEYTETVWDEQTRRFPKLYFRLDEDKNFNGFTLRWQEGSWDFIDVGYFPYENSTDLQAERKIWSFAYQLGLLEQNVPAISVQIEERKWCQSLIGALDLAGLSDHAIYQADLMFPVPPDRKNSENDIAK